MLSGEKVSEPFGPPTWITWVATFPADAAPVAAALPSAVVEVDAIVSEAAISVAAEVEEVANPPDAPSPMCVVANPSPRRAEVMSAFEKYIVPVWVWADKEWP
jgi:hypothetical protein